VAGDANAYLALSSSGDNSSYVETTSDSEVELNLDSLDESDTSTSGTGGVNPNATTVIDSVLTIANQGTQEVEADLKAPTPDSGTNQVTVGQPSGTPPGEGVYIYYDKDEDDTNDDDPEPEKFDDTNVELETGESIDVDVTVISGTSDFTGTLEIEADADDADGGDGDEAT
jgi:hypothetical protein